MLTKNKLDLEFKKQLYCENNNKEKINMTRELLIKGANPNMKMNNGSTALHFAAKDNDYHLFNLLLEFGGNINIQNCYHETPLSWAVFNRNYKIIELIVNHNDFNVNTIFLKMWGKSASTSLIQTTDSKILLIFKEKIEQEIKNKNDGLFLSAYDYNLKQNEKYINEIKEAIKQNFEEKNIEKINKISVKHEKIKKENEQLTINRKKCIII